MAGMFEDLPAVFRWQRLDFMQDFAKAHNNYPSGLAGKDKPVRLGYFSGSRLNRSLDKLRMTGFLRGASYTQQSDPA